MSIKFLNTSIEEAVQQIEEDMNHGYEALDNIRSDYGQHKENPTGRNEYWKELYADWISTVFANLLRIYTSKSRAYNFREARTTRYATDGDLPYTGYENAIEAKIQILKGYYDFIMRQSHPSITVNGDLNFQMGENISYQNNQDEE